MITGWDESSEISKEALEYLGTLPKGAMISFPDGSPAFVLYFTPTNNPLFDAIEGFNQ